MEFSLVCLSSLKIEIYKTANLFVWYGYVTWAPSNGETYVEYA
jgi:hypothetical protein